MGTDVDGPSHVVPLTPMRRAIARRMSDSKQQIPHFYLSTDIALDGLLARLATINAGRQKADRVSVTVALLHALARTLVEHPRLNAHWTDAGPEMIRSVNLGVAVALDDGLIAPALLDCAELELDELAARMRDMVSRARAGRLRAPELADATFTLSNLGMFDVTAFQAIIVPPQVAILATGRAHTAVDMRDDGLGSREVLTAWLSADHRALDGVDAARFLTALKQRLEAPTREFA